MELVQKGSEAFIPLTQLMVTMKWTTDADFDLAAIYEGKDGKIGMVYYNTLGDLNTFPYMALSGDAGVGDKGGDNEETMRIVQLDEMNKVWILCWDYGMVQKGKPARFEQSDVTLTVLDNTGKEFSIKVDTGKSGNVVCIATIDNSNPMGAKLINTNTTGVLEGIKSTDQILSTVGIK